jgi:hypothetical protein
MQLLDKPFAALTVVRMTTRTNTPNTPGSITATTYRRRTKLDNQMETAAIRLPDGRTLNATLTIIRESDKNGHKEFVAMMEKVLLPRVNTLPGASKMLGYGGTLVARTPEGTALRDALGAEPFFVDATKEVLGWLFNVDGSLFFMVLNSAAKAKVTIDEDYNMTTTNAFTTAAASIVLKYGVTTLITGPLNRIIRVAELANALKKVLITNKTTVESTVEGRLYMGGDAGVDNWDMWALFIERSYRQTVSGLTNGKHNLLLTGRWPGSETHLPGMGYKYRAKGDATVVPDPAKLKLVQDFLGWCAKPESELSNAEIAQLLTKHHNWGSHNLKKRTPAGSSATAANAIYPEKVVLNALVSGLDVWASGRYLFTSSIPWILQTENLAENIRPYIHEVGNARKLAIELDFHHEELPEGRWVAPEVIEAAGRRLKVLGQGKTFSVKTGDIKPLAGLAEWFEEENQWTISSAYGLHYILASRPAADAINSSGQRAGWTPKETKNPKAVFRPSDAHKAIAQSVIQALENGTTATRNGNAFLLGEDESNPDNITASIETVKGRIRRKAAAIEIALDKELTAQATQYMQEQEENHKELRNLELALSQCHSQTESLRPIKASQVSVAELIETMTALHETEMHAGPDLRSALQKITHRLTARLVENGTHVLLSIWVRVTTDDGSVVFGPIEAKVRDRRRKHSTDRHKNFAHTIMVEGMRPNEAAVVYGYSPRVVKVRVNRMLTPVVPSKWLRTSIVDCPIPETKRVVWAMLEAHNAGKKFTTPEGIDAAFAKHIVKTYSDPDMSWTPNWAADTHAPQRRVVEFVKEAGEEGARWLDVLKITAEAFDPQMVDYFRREMLTGKRQKYTPVVEKGPKFHSTNPERRVLLRRCPFCHTRTLTHVLHVPEVPGGKLCITCKRTPDLPGVVFPEAYMKHWSGPRGLGKGRQTDQNNGTHEATS